MNVQTQQFVYRVMVVTLAAALLAVILIDAGVIFVWRDGEAITLINQLNAPLVAGFSSLAVAMLGHQILPALAAKLAGGGVTPPAVQSSANLTQQSNGAGT
jgi:hypothetical protein